MKIKIFVLLLLASILSAVDVSEEVLATGYGIDQKQALENAFKAAVKQRIAVVIDAETMLANDDIIKDEILASANDFIDNYDIVKVNIENSLYEVTIKANIENKNIQEKVLTLDMGKAVKENKEAVKAEKESKELKEAKESEEAENKTEELESKEEAPLANKADEKANEEEVEKVEVQENKKELPLEDKVLSEAEVKKLAQEYIEDFMENIKKELLTFMELKLNKVDLDKAQFRNGKFPYNFEFQIDYNYELYEKMITELEEKLGKLGLKSKKRAAIINNYESTYSVKEAIYKDYGEIMGNQLAIVKKTDGKFSVDIWDLPFNLPRCNFDISKIRLYYELLNGNDVLDFGFENLPRHNYLCYQIYYNFYLPYWFNIDAAYIMKHYTKPFFTNKIRATANLGNVNINDLKELTVKITLEEK